MKIPSSFFLGLFLTIFSVVFSPLVTLAEDYTSSSFILRDPVIAPAGGFSSSSSFKYFSSIAQTVIGESSSTNFTDLAGFLYFATVSNPVLSGVSGDTEADLSWTASVGSLGLNISGYEIGQSTTSGSGYTYTNVGNVLLDTVTGLTNGTTYYFVVRALDALGDPTATSNEVSVTPSGPGGGGSSSGSGGSGSYQTVPVHFEFTPISGDGIKVDLNQDTRVDLIDFSVLIYWFERDGFPEEFDLNKDGIIDIVDFSIMMSYWTDI